MTIHSVTFLLVAATLTALAAKRLHLPYTVGLVLVGTALAITHLGAQLSLTRQLLYDALLPPLLFEAAISIRWADLRRDIVPILTLATAGVAISGLVVAGGMALLVHWSWSDSLIFGTLIAATDPVSALAAFKETGVVGRVRLLVEAESLLNDGIAAVFFSLAVAFATIHQASALHPLLLAGSFVWDIVGGLGVGALSGFLAVTLAGRPSADHLVETALTATAAYGSFLLAEQAHASGVLATLTAGLVMGNFGALHQQDSRFFSERGREVAEAFWEFAAFVANSLIFLLIGYGNATVSLTEPGLNVIAAAVALVWAGRAASIYPLCALFRRTALRITRSHQHVLFWGGLRGALALALALSLPTSIVHRGDIRIVTFGVVAFSVIVQGIAMPFWLRRWEIVPPQPAPAEEPVQGVT